MPAMTRARSRRERDRQGGSTRKMKVFNNGFCVVCLQVWSKDVVSLFSIFYFLIMGGFVDCLKVYSFFSHYISDTRDFGLWPRSLSSVLLPTMVEFCWWASACSAAADG